MVVGFDRYSHTDTDIVTQIYSKWIPIPILPSRFYFKRYQYLVLDSNQTVTDTDNRYNLISYQYKEIIANRYRLKVDNSSSY